MLKVPIEWQYKNIAVGIGEIAPFSFEPYENAIGCFQISSYLSSEKPGLEAGTKQAMDTPNLDFVERCITDDEFVADLWCCSVGEHILLAKYVYPLALKGTDLVKKELDMVRASLATLVLISPAKRKLAWDLDKYEKFMAALAASFDLKNRAKASKSFIELLLVLASQVDAYLRLAIVMQRQLNQKSSILEVDLMYQSETARYLSERKVFVLAQEMGLVDTDLFNSLNVLYDSRNRVVHRYIISELRSRDIIRIAQGYEEVFERVRSIVERLEDEQFAQQVGIYGTERNPQDEPSARDLRFLYAQVNDKHLMQSFERGVAEL